MRRWVAYNQCHSDLAWTGRESNDNRQLTPVKRVNIDDHCEEFEEAVMKLIPIAVLTQNNDFLASDDGIARIETPLMSSRTVKELTQAISVLE
jgi:hypothetical protein